MTVKACQDVKYLGEFTCSGDEWNGYYSSSHPNSTTSRLVCEEGVDEKDALVRLNRLVAGVCSENNFKIYGCSFHCGSILTRGRVEIDQINGFWDRISLALRDFGRDAVTPGLLGF